jgi:ATP:ADP antiporter, AAA family
VTMGRTYLLLRRFVDIRPNEVRAALYFFAYFFLITFFIYIIKPVKETFLIGITPAWWPYADLLTASLIGFVLSLNARLLNRIPRRSYLFGTGIFFVLNLLVFWLVFHVNALSGQSGPLKSMPFLAAVRNSWPIPVFVFSFWCDIFVAMSVTHFWIAVNDIFNLRQAKRTVSFLVTGGLSGGIAGSLLTFLLVHAIGPANLLTICPAPLIMILIVIDRVYAEQGRENAEFGYPGNGRRSGYLESLDTVRRNRYLILLAGLLASVVVLGSLVNYQFKIAIKAAIPNEVARTSFLGSFFLVILIVAAVFHLTTTGQVLRKFGIRTGLLLAPSVLLLGSLAVFLVPAAGLLVWACFLKGSDKTLDNTISQSMRELLYVPIPVNIKHQAKIFIDTFVTKFALGLGAVLFWILYRMPSFAGKTPFAQVREMGIFVAILACTCVVLIRIIDNEYLSVVKRNLSRRWEDAHNVVARNVDIDATHLIVDTLQSREKSSTLYAMNLFQLVQKEKLSPELLTILSLKEDGLKARSMDCLLDVGGEAFSGGIEESVADKEIQKMVQEIMALDSYRTVIEKRFADLTANAIASEAERMEAAKLAGLLSPTPGVLRCIELLLQDPSPDVLNYALGAATAHLRKEHISLIIPLLANPMTRHPAQDTLVAYGPPVEDVLKKHIQDETEHPGIRNAIPGILARLGNQKSADILMQQLSCGSEELEQEVVEAMCRIRMNQPRIHFRKKKILASIFVAVKRAYAVYLDGNGDASAAQPPFPPADRIPDIRIKRIFDLLSLIYPAEDIVRAYQNIQQGTRKSVDFSLELLDNTLDRDIKSFLFPILEDLPQEEKTSRLKKLAKSLEQKHGAGSQQQGSRKYG